jgi:hypothetical protein
MNLESEPPTAQQSKWRLQLVGGVEVLESLGDTLGHGLLTLADPDTGLYGS